MENWRKLSKNYHQYSRTNLKIVFFDSWRCILLELQHWVFEPAHNKTHSKTCATSEDSDQPVPPCSLSVFADLMCSLNLQAIQRGKNENLCYTGWIYITKTYLYNFDPLKPHFYIAKLGFTGIYIIFLISAQKHRLWVCWGSSKEYPQSVFLSRNMKNIRFFLSE